MEKEAKSETCAAKVVVDLSWGSAMQFVCGLNFDHQILVYDHIEPLPRD
jgi:hypothetical protein